MSILDLFPVVQPDPGAEPGQGERQATVIKNEKQYRITRVQVRRFEEAVSELARQDRPGNVSPRLWAAQRDAAESQLHDLCAEVETYEGLHLGKSKELLLDAVENLLKTLIRARIVSGMTQEGLGRLLGIKTPTDPAL